VEFLAVSDDDRPISKHPQNIASREMAFAAYLADDDRTDRWSGAIQSAEDAVFTDVMPTISLALGRLNITPDQNITGNARK
jgi:hypothetical protein